MRNALAVEQCELYVQTITNINMRYRELLKNDFGATLVKNCAWDVADTLANRYFNTADFYISTIPLTFLLFMLFLEKTKVDLIQNRQKEDVNTNSLINRQKVQPMRVEQHTSVQYVEEQI